MEEVIGKIREYANKAKDSAVKLTRTVTDKTSNVVDQTKLKLAISKTEDKIKEIYTQIGGEIYTGYIEGGSAPDVRELCEKLDDLHKEADNLREQLAELKETVKCPSCGAYNGEDDVYCSKCGEKLSYETAAPAEAETAAEEFVDINVDAE